MSWFIVQTLAHQLQKRVLLSQLLSEWLDVVPPTFHLSATTDASWIVRVWVGVREEGAWEYLTWVKSTFCMVTVYPVK